eukprot:15437039-Alexandrium_andersonii.AAC.1
MRQHSVGDTQEVEGVNSLIRIQGKRSPNISLELLSARVGMKKALGISAQTSKRSAKAALAQAASLADVGVQCLEDAHTIVAREDRWAPPLALEAPDIVRCKPDAKQVWAAGHNSTWHASCGAVTATK